MTDILPPLPPKMEEKKTKVLDSIGTSLTTDLKKNTENKDKNDNKEKTESQKKEPLPPTETSKPSKDAKPQKPEMPKTNQEKEKNESIFLKLLSKIENKRSPEYKSIKHNIDISQKELEETTLPAFEERLELPTPTSPKKTDTKISKISKPEKHDWASPPDITSLLIKHNKELKSTRDFLISNTSPGIEPAIAAKPANLSLPQEEIPISKAEKHFNKLHSSMEKNKNDLLKKSDNLKPDQTKVKIKREYEKFQSELKKTHKEQSKIYKSQLAAKQKKLSDEQKKLDLKIARMNQLEQKLNLKQKKINEQAGIMDAYSRQINDLEDGIEKNKEILQRLKTEVNDLRLKSMEEKKRLDDLKKATLNQDVELRTRLKTKQDEFKTLEREHLIRMKQMEKESREAHEEFEMIKEKSEAIMKNLESKEAEISAKKQKVEALLKEEKRISDFLKSQGTKETESTRQISMDSSENQEQYEFDKDYSEKFEVHEESAETGLQEKINDCRQLAEEGNIEDAKVLYNEIRAELLDGSFAPEISSKLKSEIKELYEDICLKILRG